METPTTHFTFSPPDITLDTMSSSDCPEFLKMEDVHASSPSIETLSTPPPVIVHSKAAKKRKSWGQQLPTPTTNLPPRKRAKTDDEKEQRRIERIKRNRAAAHNSRERKRQETEVLAVALAKANARLDAYERLHGPLPASVVLPDVTLCIEPADTPAPSLTESRGSVDIAATPSSPPEDSLFDDDCTTTDNVTIKQETDYLNTTVMPTLSFDMSSLTSKQGNMAPSLLDPTQHSAAMLCDLPCRSSQRSSSSHSSPLTQASWWTALFLRLMTFSLQATYKTFLLALWATMPSRMARMMQLSVHRLTSRSTNSSTTPLLLSRSTAALAQLNAATRLPVTGRGAYLQALQQRSVTEGRNRIENVPATAARQQHHASQQRQRQSSGETRAFEEYGMENGLGDGNHDGVGH